MTWTNSISLFYKTEDWLVRGLDLKPWNLVPRTYPPWVNKNIRDVFSPETVSKGLNGTDLDIRDVKSELQSFTKITYKMIKEFNDPKQTVLNEL